MIRNHLHSISRRRLYPPGWPTYQVATSNIRVPNAHRFPPGARSFAEFLRGSNPPYSKINTDFVPHLRRTLIRAIRRRDPRSNERGRSILFLVSPDNASLVSDHEFLQTIVQEAVEPRVVGVNSIDIVAAVIDGYAQFGPKGGSLGGGWSALVTDRRFDVYSSVGEAYDQYLCTGEPTPMSVAKSSVNTDFTPGDLQLQFQTVKYDKNNRLSEEEEEEFTPMKVKWKLANTLFETGKATTMARHFYTFKHNAETDKYDMTKAISENLRDMTVLMNEGLKFAASVVRPLKPITKPRKISRAFGNIIQELTMQNAGVDTTIQASKELEPAIEEFLVAHPEYKPGKQDGLPLDIYARLTEDPYDPYVGMIKRPSMPGTSIARVLSGGGGWGANAGILALDPDNMPEFKIAGEGHSEGKGLWIQFYARREGERLRSKISQSRVLFNILGKIQIGEVGSSEFLRTEEPAAGSVSIETESGFAEKLPAESVSAETTVIENIVADDTRTKVLAEEPTPRFDTVEEITISTEPSSTIDAQIETGEVATITPLESTVENPAIMEIKRTEPISENDISVNTASPGPLVGIDVREFASTEPPPNLEIDSKEDLSKEHKLAEETQPEIDQPDATKRTRILSVGSETAFWIDGVKLDIRGSQIVLDFYGEEYHIDGQKVLEKYLKTEKPPRVLSRQERDVDFKILPYKWDKDSGKLVRSPWMDARSRPRAKGKAQKPSDSKSRRKGAFGHRKYKELLEFYGAIGASSNSRDRNWMDQQVTVVNPRTEHSTDKEAMLHDMQKKK
ncbi:hypothetical protein TWF694_003465 [Orbilia ellipsospora]|uniref:Uncharacterized protein n=1 Tax=Orbilia ellipsospora TaxID=2528407 RepID=A0AAV9WYA5_9PEZI